MPERPCRVLLVDDDPAILRAYKRGLTQVGCVVVLAEDGAEAVAQIAGESFDAIVSDVAMPNMGGLEFLRAVRERDLDVPVILVTGSPGLDTAMRAVELGAFRYLVKPVEVSALAEVVRHAAHLHEMARLKRAALESLSARNRLLGDRAGLEVRFAHAVEHLWIAHQPIVACAGRRVFGYEALARTAEPTLADPELLLDAAERLGRVHELGRTIRARIATAAAAKDLPADALLFVNVHPHDLEDEALFDPAAPLSAHAARTVLEITERVSLDDVRDVMARVGRLRALGYQIAVDDLGAGYAGLTTFVQLEPDLVKLDRALVSGLDAQPRRQAIVRSMKQMCDELGILIVAEGVETAAERDTLIGLGFDLLQGYVFARPERGYPLVDWSHLT